MTVALFREVCFELGAWVHDNHLGHPENALPRVHESFPDNLRFFRAVSNQRIDHLKSCAPTDSVKPEIRLSVVLLFDEVDPYDMVEAVGLWHCCRPSRFGSPVALALGADEVLSYPVSDVRLAVATAKQFREILGGRMPTVLMSNL